MTLRLPLAFLVGGTLAFAASVSAQSRGEMLYTTHCISCHTTQMHWRDKRSATDWPSLKAQVRRWQGAISLGWSEADTLEVARHLNETIYHFEQTGDTRSSHAPLTPASGPAPRVCSVRTPAQWPRGAG